jgi:hypothetical protein
VTATLHEAEMCHLALAEATLDVEFRGCGEPVVLIQTAVTADGFLPWHVSPSATATCVAHYLRADGVDRRCGGKDQCLVKRAVG